ncbi:MAG: cell division protein FtsH, partial [Alphaproteobacteria bacterium]|nr:cell division protein FtsH [Alphaproteobacteria bacterium]
MNDEQPNGNPWLKSLLVWGGIFLALLMVVSMFGTQAESGTAIPYSEFRDSVAEGRVAEVQIAQDKIVGT